jgi:hypothetical protein
MREYKNKMTCNKCSANIRSFAFSTGETITLCPSCGHETGHDILRKFSMAPVTEDVNNLWGDMLQRQSLSMESGTSRHLSYGHRYVPTDVPFDYKPIVGKKVGAPMTIEERARRERAEAERAARADVYKSRTEVIAQAHGWAVNGRGKSEYVGTQLTEAACA